MMSRLMKESRSRETTPVPWILNIDLDVCDLGKCKGRQRSTSCLQALCGGGTQLFCVCVDGSRC